MTCSFWNRRDFIKTMGLAAMSTGLPSCQSGNGKKLNVIVIYTDDQNFSQLGCFGGKVLTPHMDRLAKEGVKLTRYYASSPVCTPSRYNMLTGKFAGRCASLKEKYPLKEPTFIRWNTFLTKGETTIAQIMRNNGYKTGMVGKYHLFDNESVQKYVAPDADPNDASVREIMVQNYKMISSEIRKTAGFDYAESIYANNLHAVSIPKSMQFHNMEWITKGALDFIKQNSTQPFFLYMASTIPHGPSPLSSMKSDPRITPAGYLNSPPRVQPSREDVFRRVKEAGYNELSAPVTWLDDAVGAVLNKLEKLRLTENTMIILASDHGSAKGKMTCYEGGAKAPAIVWYPQKFKGGYEINEVTSNIDLAPTILDVCGITTKPEENFDGRSIKPLLKGKKSDWRKSLYLEAAYSKGVVTENWKYIAVRYPKKIKEQITAENRKEFNQEGMRSMVDAVAGKVNVRYKADEDYPGYFDDDQLYNLKSDPFEKNNLALTVEYAEKLKEMKQIFQKYSKTLPHRFGEFGKSGKE